MPTLSKPMGSSSDNIAISVRSISKSYFETPLSLSERPTVLEFVKNGLGAAGKPKDKFRALDNVSFDVPKGTSLGIIGNNGAGKSTLMQVLAGITKPDNGEVEIRGRVASILSVGTGFHPDLTGKENVYMSGQMIGMTKQEVEAAYDDIVAFSELQGKMNQQVKYYSNGMYLRLAFSVFSHLKSDIVLLDEVYSVGDAFFRKKCELAIDRMLNDGRTVVIVSHSISDLKNNVQKMLLLSDGKVVCHDTNEVVLEKYFLDPSNQDLNENLMAANGKFDGQLEADNHLFRISSISLKGASSGVEGQVERSEAISVEMQLERKLPDTELAVVLVVHSIDGKRVMMDSTMFRDQPEFIPNETGIYNVNCVLPGNMLYKGTYFINVRITDKSANILYETGAKHLLRVLPANWEEQTELSQFNISVQPRFDWTLQKS